MHMHMHTVLMMLRFVCAHLVSILLCLFGKQNPHIEAYLEICCVTSLILTPEHDDNSWGGHSCFDPTCSYHVHCYVTSQLQFSVRICILVLTIMLLLCLQALQGVTSTYSLHLNSLVVPQTPDSSICAQLHHASRAMSGEFII